MKTADRCAWLPKNAAGGLQIARGDAHFGLQSTRSHVASNTGRHRSRLCAEPACATVRCVQGAGPLRWPRADLLHVAIIAPARFTPRSPNDSPSPRVSQRVLAAPEGRIGHAFTGAGAALPSASPDIADVLIARWTPERTHQARAAMVKSARIDRGDRKNSDIDERFVEILSRADRRADVPAPDRSAQTEILGPRAHADVLVSTIDVVDPRLRNARARQVRRCLTTDAELLNSSPHDACVLRDREGRVLPDLPVAAVQARGRRDRAYRDRPLHLAKQGWAGTAGVAVVAASMRYARCSRCIGAPPHCSLPARRRRYLDADANPLHAADF